MFRCILLKRMSTYASIWARKHYDVRIQMQKYPKGYRNKQQLLDLQVLVLTAYKTPETYAERIIQLAKQLNRQGYYQSVLQVGKQDNLLDGDQKRQLLDQQQYALSKIPAEDAPLYQLKHPGFSNFMKLARFFLNVFLTYMIFKYSFELLKNIQGYLNSDEKQPKSKSKRPSALSKLLETQDNIVPEQNIKTRFTDVIGVDEFKEELMELTDYLKNPEKYRDAGGRLPKGILLVGPPGTGKTLMARALAGQVNCNFFYKSGAEFDEMYVGQGAARVRALFKKARESAPSIIFIDEIDSLAGKRGAQGSYINNAGRDTISEVLTAMDGFKPSQNVIVIGATNLEDNIDPAIKRAGRFDKILHVPIPDIEGRKQLFAYYLNKTKQEEGLDIKVLAKRTTGFTGADIQNMVNLAIMNAVKNLRQQTVSTDYEYAYDRILMGVGRKNMIVPKDTKKMSAYRQIGQAITALLTPGATPLHKVTILPRGKDMGFTASMPDKDILNHTKKSMEAQIDVLMGGRVAEELFSGTQNVTTTSGQNLAKATSLAYRYLTTGMNQSFSLIYVSKDFKISQHLKFAIDKQVEKMLSESYERVRFLLVKQKKNVNALVNTLVEKETLSAEEIKKVLRLI